MADEPENTVPTGKHASGASQGNETSATRITPIQPDGTPSVIGRVEVDRELCIGATTCVAVSPDAFEMDDENKAVVKNLHGDTDDNILEAARACPVAAIFVYDTEGKQVYP